MATATTGFHRFPPIDVSFFHLSFSVAMATASTDFHRSTSRSSISLSVAIAMVAIDIHRSTLTLSLRQLSGMLLSVCLSLSLSLFPISKFSFLCQIYLCPQSFIKIL
ncbi:hypothetical protein HYC85_022090 [Camellia sinensis]|uniref:Uncharacterized protein n=1 Tax=Camellia sinensis TaxID=4442 RepID=A0A7J7GJE7_CAMSI|nr:hypothetical protein HYC85_022090 [Camellia sinensis]